MFTQLTGRQGTELLASVATARLRRFRRAAPGGQHGVVLAMYVLDAEVSSRLHTCTRALELLLREGVHAALARTYGSRWFENRTLRAALDPRVVAGIDDALAHLGQRSNGIPSPGKVVAELMLGTWVQMLDRGVRDQQAGAVWPTVRSAFENDQPASARSRTEIHTLARRFQWARNRVNHCEPVIFGFPQLGQRTPDGRSRRLTPQQLLDDLRQLAACLNPVVGDWMSEWGRIDQLLGERTAQLALDAVASDQRVSLEGRRSSN